MFTVRNVSRAVLTLALAGAVTVPAVAAPVRSAASLPVATQSGAATIGARKVPAVAKSENIFGLAALPLIVGAVVVVAVVAVVAKSDG